MPQRIQRRRTPGWRMPEGAVYVERPTMWGNPWSVGTLRPEPLLPLTAEQVVRRFERWLTLRVAAPFHGVERARILNSLHQLRGKDLACWCGLDQPCHADVLLRLANGSAS